VTSSGELHWFGETDVDQPLDREAKVFEQHIDEWRKTRLGQFVLIKGDQVIDFFPSLEQAFRAGTGRFGLEPFSVRQIVPSDVVNVSLYGRRIHAA
jgi:hypothetical protein